MRKKIENCPNGCEEYSLSTCWAMERKLVQKCPECHWTGVPYTPPKRRISASKRVFTNDAAWVYEGFDQFGHTFVHSRSYSSRKACEEAAREEVNKASLDPHYGRCSAVVWPPSTTLRGKVIRGKKSNAKRS